MTQTMTDTPQTDPHARQRHLTSQLLTAANTLAVRLLLDDYPRQWDGTNKRDANPWMQALVTEDTVAAVQMACGLSSLGAQGYLGHVGRAAPRKQSLGDTLSLALFCQAAFQGAMDAHDALVNMLPDFPGQSAWAVAVAVDDSGAWDHYAYFTPKTVDEMEATLSGWHAKAAVLTGTAPAAVPDPKAATPKTLQDLLVPYQVRENGTPKTVQELIAQVEKDQADMLANMGPGGTWKNGVAPALAAWALIAYLRHQWDTLAGELNTYPRHLASRVLDLKDDTDEAVKKLQTLRADMAKAAELLQDEHCEVHRLRQARNTYRDALVQLVQDTEVLGGEQKCAILAEKGQAAHTFAPDGL